jgi:hypothetical protein
MSRKRHSSERVERSIAVTCSRRSWSPITTPLALPPTPTPWGLLVVSAVAPENTPDRPRARVALRRDTDVGTLPMIPTIPTMAMAMTTMQHGHMLIAASGRRTLARGSRPEDTRTMSGGGACCGHYAAIWRCASGPMFGAAAQLRD